MRILVTGGGGFLGSEIIQQLLARGESVRSLGRGAQPGLAARGVEVVQGDLADAAAVAKAVTGCEAVIHSAAKAGVIEVVARRRAKRWLRMGCPLVWY